MNETEQLVWQTALRHPHWGAPQIATLHNLPESEVAAVLAKSGSAEPERIRLLKRGIELTGGDRNKTYGPPYENLTACATMWKAYLIAKYGGRILDSVDFELVAEDVGHLMQLVKMTRTFHGPYHADNYVDNAVYGAIAGECRIEEERE
jgi:hypothetical protein